VIATDLMEAAARAEYEHDHHVDTWKHLKPGDVEFWLTSHGYPADVGSQTKCRRITWRYLDGP
jgi:hypothetical protein